LLLSTSYILLTEDLLAKMMLIDQQIMVINSRLELWRERGFVKSVEENLEKELPPFKVILMSAMKDFAKLEKDYQNDNYQEPREPTVLPSTTEHLDILKEIISSQE